MPTQFFTNLSEEQNAMLVEIIQKTWRLGEVFEENNWILKIINTITEAPSFFPVNTITTKKGIMFYSSIKLLEITIYPNSLNILVPMHWKVTECEVFILCDQEKTMS